MRVSFEDEFFNVIDYTGKDKEVVGHQSTAVT